jgi:cytochrome bd-type quinol oxidase subunit 2
MPPQPYTSGFPNDLNDFLTWPIMIGALVILAWLVIVGLTGWLASRKHRDDGLWATLALFFGPFALIAILVLPAAIPDTTEPPPPVPSNDSRGGWGEGVK